MSCLVLHSPSRLVAPILWMWKLRSRGSIYEGIELRVRTRSSDSRVTSQGAWVA